MNRLGLASALMLLPFAALAQQPPSPIEGVVAAAVEKAYNLGAATGQQIQKKLDDLDEYARRCGDQPGCFVPVKPPDPEPAK